MSHSSLDMNGLPGSPPTLNCAKRRRMEEGILVDMEVKENFNKGKFASINVSKLNTRSESKIILTWVRKVGCIVTEECLEVHCKLILQGNLPISFE